MSHENFQLSKGTYNEVRARRPYMRMLYAVMYKQVS